MNVPSANALARHNPNASGLFLQTRPTGNGATLLMAIVTNGCDLDRRRHGHAGRAWGGFFPPVLSDRDDGRSLTRGLFGDAGLLRKIPRFRALR